MTTDPHPSPVEIAGRLRTAITQADLTLHWNLLCDADPLPCDRDEYINRMELAGLIALVPVDEEALDDPFASERGIEPGGMMYQLTPLGKAVRAELEREGGE